jgi:hypothetical protein
MMTLSGTTLQWAQFVVHLRMFTLLVLIGVFVWILNSAPAGRYRTIRLLLVLFLVILNVITVGISVQIFGVPPL